MAGNGSPPAVYNARLRRIVFSSREQHERDLRWLVFSRGDHGPGSGGGKVGGAREQQVAAGDGAGAGTATAAAAAAATAATGGCCVGMDSRDSVRALARQRRVDAALRSVLDLPCLRQY